MKILYFGGGLGNQVFEYSFYLYLKDFFPKEKFYGIYDASRFKEHAGGFELSKVFNVELPPFSWKAHWLMRGIMLWNRILKTPLYCHNLTNPNIDAVLFNAFKMSKIFYEKRIDWISFKPINLCEKNKRIIDLMMVNHSVSIHVRRGDFLSAKYAVKHAGVATEMYYSRSIKYVNEQFKNPMFFVFSDDIQWCKNNLGLENAHYVDWNVGKNSYIDMYLMGFSKVNIIANSTFSYWGAYLSKNKPLVIYPRRWKFSEADNLDIFPEEWVAIE